MLVGDRSVLILFYRFGSSLSRVPLLRRLRPCCSLEKDWHHLQLHYSDLKVIKRNEPNEEERLMAMLHQWLTSGRATKQALLMLFEGSDRLSHELYLHCITTQCLLVIAVLPHIQRCLTSPSQQECTWYNHYCK